ncbi:uncharacterized protein LOC131876362 isoform X1 [Cryptomeria japonica]|uniref:uncharacterized protein LOC131876362 isoform X1 n=1 Tax=Cryptomeria japonica TaxID=3369 RepID=UPI0027DA7800|nr:uncharacterized protein LOC131876362 isoform X1 [Cryptomeria japonica]
MGDRGLRPRSISIPQSLVLLEGNESTSGPTLISQRSYSTRSTLVSQRSKPAGGLALVSQRSIVAHFVQPWFFRGPASPILSISIPRSLVLLEGNESTSGPTLISQRSYSARSTLVSQRSKPASGPALVSQRSSVTHFVQRTFLFRDNRKASKIIRKPKK